MRRTRFQVKTDAALIQKNMHTIQHIDTIDLHRCNDNLVCCNYHFSWYISFSSIAFEWYKRLNNEQKWYFKRELTCEDFFDDTLANGSKHTNQNENYEAEWPYLCQPKIWPHFYYIYCEFCGFEESNHKPNIIKAFDLSNLRVS